MHSLDCFEALVSQSPAHFENSISYMLHVDSFLVKFVVVSDPLYIPILQGMRSIKLNLVGVWNDAQYILLKLIRRLHTLDLVVIRFGGLICLGSLRI